ncbi:MAG: alkaline phosphatase [bacterium]|nr:alkaline phosphatase [bacterium]
MLKSRFVFALLVLLCALPTLAFAQEGQTGNVIFVHPDGTGLNHWNAGRMYWEGPDGLLEWDQLPFMAVYRGHMFDRLTGTSNGGATVHAFGYKVEAAGSFGLDGNEENARPFLSLSGYEGSIMREAANNGHPVGVVNDGQAAEPGTAVFLAEVGNRNQYDEIVRQILDGRPGYEDVDQLPQVVLGGGEIYFLPEGTPLCEAEITPTCAVHTGTVEALAPVRTDGRNLIQEAVDAGWTVIRTRAEFDALMAELEADETLVPRVLGIFAADNIMNDYPEEAIIGAGLVDESMAEDPRGSIILYGSAPGTPGYNPPMVDEMTAMALMILERASAQAQQPFLMVLETESTDNFGNNDNAIGMLNGLRYTDNAIGVLREFQARVPETLIITAADSDAGGMQVFSPAPVNDDGTLRTVSGNPTGADADAVNVPLDGIMGRGSAPFVTPPDAFGNTQNFAIGWIGTPDVAGGILTRAQGLNADLLNTMFAGSFDSTDVYRMMYVTLFGEMLPSAIGQRGPDRE